ncbi:MAG: DUF1800 family protein [Bryobacterales bacterium]|nr:DUF1800 family protein [Bryobacterales bacterium]
MLLYGMAALSLAPFPLGAVTLPTAQGTGLYGEYFATQNLTGSATVRRTDRQINFVWGLRSPLVTRLDEFSVRWTGEVEAPVTGDYTFATTSDDGVRLWVNGKKLIDEWTNHSATLHRAPVIKLTAGQRYSIRMEYFEGYGNAIAKLHWAYPGQAEQVIPQARLYVPERVDYLSDMQMLRKSNGVGPVELDMSNGGAGTKDGKTLTIDGVSFAKGLGVNADSEVVYKLNRMYDDFRATIGLDDEVPANQGSVTYEVWVDGTLKYDSLVKRGNMAGEFIRVDVTGHDELRLVVKNGGDGNTMDRADWADAHLILQSGGPAPTPDPDMDPYLSELQWTSATNGWGPPERDMSNGETMAADGKPMAINGRKFTYGLGVHANSEIVYNLGKQFQRFVADVGVDDEVQTRGSVVFQVFGDGRKLFETTRMTGGMTARRADLSLAGVTQLKLVVLDAGDGIGSDHADWGGARVYRVGGTPPPTVTPPVAPTDFAATGGNAKVTLKWTAPAGATSYNLYRGTAAGQQAATPVAMGIASTTYADTTVTNGTMYYYKVAGVNAGGIGARSAEASARPEAPIVAPPAPTLLTATAGNAQVVLTWAATAGAVSYNVYRGTTAGGQSGTPVVTGLTALTYTNTGLTNDTTYYYKIAAVNTGGTSPRSNELSAKPQAPISPPNPVPTSDQALWRLLRQTTWGPTQADFDRLKQMGVNAWLDEQFAQAPSVYPDTLLDKSMEWTEEHFFKLALTGNDQLRQRVAWALSQIWVVSGVEIVRADGMIPYIRLLQDRAFGNFYDLMRDVTLNPAMGEYLDMVNNKKASGSYTPNENFAREVLQLFTIGLTELNADGSAKLNGLGQPIPTYTQDDILELSRVFTGWTYPDTTAGQPTRLNQPRYDRAMEAVEAFHDTGAKRFLGTDVAPGMTAAQDLDNALQIIFRHPNVGPFISRQLIQRMVTSNPSPAYIGAVAAVFANNGAGVRGDLRAVVRAILTHPEAQLGGATAGKLAEPALFMTRQLRAIGGNVADYPFLSDLSVEMGQRIFHSPSVFNYYSPNYRIPGTQLTGPEFQLYTTATGMIRANFVARLISGGFGSEVTLNLTPWTNLAADAGALVNEIDKLAFGGTMSAPVRTAMLTAIGQSPTAREKVLTAFYIAFASSQFQVEH